MLIQAENIRILQTNSENMTFLFFFESCFNFSPALSWSWIVHISLISPNFNESWVNNMTVFLLPSAHYLHAAWVNENLSRNWPIHYFVINQILANFKMMRLVLKALENLAEIPMLAWLICMVDSYALLLNIRI